MQSGANSQKENRSAKAAHIKAYKKFLSLSACALVVAIVFGTLGPTVNDLPQQRDLSEVSGRLMSHKWGGWRNYEIIFRLDGFANSFSYPQKNGDSTDIWDLLCDGCLVKLSVRGDGRIYQIIQNGQSVRSYQDVRAAWIEDDHETPWLAAAAFFVAALSGGYAAYQYRQTRRNVRP